MKIFSDEFKNVLKKYFICSILKHNFAWMEYWWAIGHSTGEMMHTCKRCCFTDKVRIPDMYIGDRLERKGKEITYKEWKKGKHRMFTKENSDG